MLRKLVTWLVLACIILHTVSAEEVIVRKLKISSDYESEPSGLQTLTSGFEGRAVSVSLLREILEKVTRFYQEHGHPSSKAYLPEQGSLDGLILVKVVEPKIRRLTIESDSSKLKPKAVSRLLGFKGHEFPRDLTVEDIKSKFLMFSDLRSATPGGYLTQEGDSSYTTLTMELKPRPTFNAEVFYDNHGNKYSGTSRLGFMAKTYNLTGNSDSASIFLAGSNEHQRNLSLSYSVPLNSYFTALGVSLCYASYELGGVYRELGAQGQAISAALFVHQPLIRQVDQSLALNLSGQYRKDVDEYKEFDLRFKRHVVSANLELEGYTALTDRLFLESRTGILAGSITDESGYFEKRREHYSLLHSHTSISYRFTEMFTLQDELKVQLASHGVDTSDALELSGPEGVAAYASGTALGDSGYVNSLSLIVRPAKSLNLTLAPQLAFGLVRNQDGGESTHLSSLGLKLSYFQSGFFVKASLQKALGSKPEHADEKLFLLKFGYQYV